MGSTDDILAGLLQEIASQQGHGDPQEAADWLVYRPNGWIETEVRISLYRELGPLLRADPLHLPAVRRVVGRDDGVLGGFGGFKARVGNFLKHDRTPALLHVLLSDRRQPPDAARIDAFIEEATAIALHGPSGHPPDMSGAALLTSVLLTAAFPADFVDFRQSRWDTLAANFDLPVRPEGTYGDRIVWAAAIAKQFASTATFQRYLVPAGLQRFNLEHPTWLVAGLAFLFHRNSDIRALLRPVPRRARVAHPASGPSPGGGKQIDPSARKTGQARKAGLPRFTTITDSQGRRRIVFPHRPDLPPGGSL